MRSFLTWMKILGMYRTMDRSKVTLSQSKPRTNESRMLKSKNLPNLDQGQTTQQISTNLKSEILLIKDLLV